MMNVFTFLKDYIIFNFNPTLASQNVHYSYMFMLNNYIMGQYRERGSRENGHLEFLFISLSKKTEKAFKNFWMATCRVKTDSRNHDFPGLDSSSILTSWVSLDKFLNLSVSSAVSVGWYDNTYLQSCEDWLRNTSSSWTAGPGRWHMLSKCPNTGLWASLT